MKGAPSFAHLHVLLEPGESIIAEADAMSSMSANLDMMTKFNGGFFSGLCKRFLGGESLFVNEFINNTGEVCKVTLVQATPGNMREVDLNGETLCLQPGAYICSTPGIKLGLKWAGFASFIAREGLFKLTISGVGKAWIGAYGELLEKEVEGEYIVDTAHLVSYEPQLKLKVQLAGGIFSSFFGGEGLVTRIQGTGKIVIQTRSLTGLASWLNPRII
ncbi:MAG TPA: TIGR00266 family protein [Verrucomicrobiae bacterium]